MKFDISKEDIINQIVADTIREILTAPPADEYKADQQNPAENIAYIELHEDVLDEAYDMSQEYREYD